MAIYLIEGKNKSGETGTWEIEAEDTDALEKIIKTRGMQADKINGDSVKRAKPITPRETD